MDDVKFGLKLGKIITPFETISDGLILIDNTGEIIYVGSSEDISYNDNIIDLRDKTAIPGYIDIHIHGVAGVDTIEGKLDSLQKMSKFLATKGVTSFLPTTVTSPLEMILKAVEAVRKAKLDNIRGAKIIGAHLEGPYLSKEKADAQDIRYLREPNLDEIREIDEKYGDAIIRVTLAPEIKGALDVIKYLTKKGYLVAIGHTNADFETTVKAINAGARLTNHIYNGMRTFHHRDPGVLGAVLTRDDIFVEMIVDDIHHHYAARKIVLKCKGTEKVALITDAIMATGLPDGEYKLGEQKIIIKNGISRLPDGTLAGSTLTMDAAVRNTFRHLDVSLNDAVKMATYVPARILGLDHKIGQLKPGYKADITILDEPLNVYMTIVEGNIIFTSEKV